MCRAYRNIPESLAAVTAVKDDSPTYFCNVPNLMFVCHIKSCGGNRT